MIVFSAAWRVFFPAAGLFAGLAIPLWLLIFADQIEVMVNPLAWHMHEMLFGYMPAALAGFLLTAIPNWTGRPALKGTPLAILFALWLAGRVGMFMAPGAVATTLAAMVFLPLLALMAARDILSSGNRRNLIVVELISLLSAAQAIMLFGPADTGINAGLATILVLMVLIGGRITPAFSRNWLMKRGQTTLPAPFGLTDKIAMALTGAAALIWSVTGASALTGVGALLASLGLLARVARWQGWSVRKEPLLLAQHIAYFWLAVAMGFLALSSLSDWATLGQTRHAIGAGAIASMTTIVMLRAALGHSGRPIVGGAIDWLLFTSLYLGATLRIVSDWSDNPTLMWNLAGFLWAFAFLLFTIRVLPIALTPRK